MSAERATLPAGPWSSSPQDGKRGNCLIAQVWGPQGNSLAEIEPTDDPADASALARAIAALPDLVGALGDLIAISPVMTPGSYGDAVLGAAVDAFAKAAGDRS